MNLTPEELKRYSRHLLLPEIGTEGQLKLKSARILVVGAGGLGSPALIYLAATGIGTIGIIDPDRVEFSNLHRQVVHFTNDVGEFKTDSAFEKITALNPGLVVKTHTKYFDEKNALELLADYDLVIDGTDNFQTRYLINDACVMTGKPFIFGGVYRFEGQCSVFNLENGPCYRCLFREPPRQEEVPSCAEAGVIGILPGIIGLLQANEAVKIVCGIGEPLKGRLMIFDALAARFRDVRFSKDPDCPICSPVRQIRELKKIEIPCSLLFDSDEITPLQLRELMNQAVEDFVLVDVREPEEWEIVRIEGAELRPLSRLKSEYTDLPRERRIVLYCKLGGRSRKALEFLKSKGYQNLLNLKGGIEAWTRDTGPGTPQH